MTEKHSSPYTHQQISVHAQYVKDLSFENPAAPDCFVKTLGQPDVQIGVMLPRSALMKPYLKLS